VGMPTATQTIKQHNMPYTLPAMHGSERKWRFNPRGVISIGLL